MKQFNYGPSLIGDTHYSNNLEKFKILNKYLSGFAWFHTIDDDKFSKEHLLEASNPLSRAALITKHIGFLEETECRIVALVPTEQTRKKINTSKTKRKPKSKRIFTHNGRAFIKFFEHIDTPLPIKRIIVGPSRLQEETANRVKWIAGEETVVTLSDTPFIQPNRNPL